jgi:hypothetical protein
MSNNVRYYLPQPRSALKVPLPAAKSNRGLFGGHPGDGPKIKKTHSKDTAEGGLGRKESLHKILEGGKDDKDREKDKEGEMEKGKEEKGKEKEGDVHVTASKSMFSNLFNTNSRMSNGAINVDIHKDIKKNECAEHDDREHADADDDEEDRHTHPSKRKYTQFGYFSRRPTCTADSDFLTIVVSGIEVSDLFYVDRLWSPKPYLELTVGNTLSVVGEGVMYDVILIILCIILDLIFFLFFVLFFVFHFFFYFIYLIYFNSLS